jgi:hypothetical protein
MTELLCPKHARPVTGPDACVDCLYPIADPVQIDEAAAHLDAFIHPTEGWAPPLDAERADSVLAFVVNRAPELIHAAIRAARLLED